jgi:hypothetical protein
MLKHIGKHNQRKIALIYRQVPGEDHMCLLVYSDLLPRLVHDEIMKTIESASGQAAENLADALWRNVMADGRNTLEVLHKESYIKKVPTNQVIMTPTTKATIRLDELNTILTEMAQGADAVKRMAQLDSELGVGNGKRRQPNDVREVGVPRNSRSKPAEMPLEAEAVLTDDVLAMQRMEQAEKMKASAAQLLAEAERLTQEAMELNPTTTTKAPRKNAKKKAVEAH